MDSKRQSRNFLFHSRERAATAGLVLVLMVMLSLAAQAQTFKVLHTFTCGRDGAFPQTGLTMDAAGNLYGTTVTGGSGGSGVVFKLKHSNSGWILNPLYSFTGSNDGASPLGRVACAADGTLYGTTEYGGGNGCYEGSGCGTVFHLTPSPVAPRSALAPWNETWIHKFTGSDGAYPTGDLIFDQVGNLYGTTRNGGPYTYLCIAYEGCGVVYELTPSGGGWTEAILYSFQGAPDGGDPFSGVVFDNAGNLYGVTLQGGQYGGGTVYQLSSSGSGWTEQILHDFTGGTDGWAPTGGLIIDSSGNFYGTTTGGGANGAGTVFELTPSGTMVVLYDFPPAGCPYGWLCGSLDKLVMDANGNLYGTVAAGGAYGWGDIFKLTAGSGGWTYSSLHQFTGQGDSTGASPQSGLILDATGNLYGTATEGGTYNCGTVYEITP